MNNIKAYALIVESNINNWSIPCANLEVVKEEFSKIIEKLVSTQLISDSENIKVTHDLIDKLKSNDKIELKYKLEKCIINVRVFSINNNYK